MAFSPNLFSFKLDPAQPELCPTQIGHQCSEDLKNSIGTRIRKDYVVVLSCPLSLFSTSLFLLDFGLGLLAIVFISAQPSLALIVVSFYLDLHLCYLALGWSSPALE